MHVSTPQRAVICLLSLGAMLFLPLYAGWCQAPLDTMAFHMSESHAAIRRTVAYSPDGRYLATGYRDNAVALWEIDSERLLRVFATPVSGTTHAYGGDWVAVAFSPKGDTLLTGDRDGVLRLWEVHSGKELRQFRGHTGCIVSVQFSPDGHRALTGSTDQTARLWEMETGQEIRVFRSVKRGTDLTSFLLPHYDVAFSPDDRLAATSVYDEGYWLWDLQTGAKVRELRPKDIVAHGAVNAITFSPDGQLLLIADDSRNGICLYAVATGKRAQRLIGHTQDAFAVAFTPDGRTAVTAAQDKTVRVWDVATGKERRKLDTSALGYEGDWDRCPGDGTGWADGRRGGDL